METGRILALLGAALAVIMCGAGSAYGVSVAGQASAGVAAEDGAAPGRHMAMQALPGTQAIYGFITGLMVMLKTDALAGMVQLTPEQGWLVLIACLPMAVVGLVSAICQGRLAASAIGASGLNPAVAGRGVAVTALVETCALLALAASCAMIWCVV